MGSGTNAILNGTTWTITLNIVFYQPYGAPVTVLVDGAADPNTTTHWLSFPGLTFPNVSSSTPATVAIVSNNGLSLESDIQIFSVRLRDTSGGIATWHAELLFFQGNSWVPGFAYFKNASNRCRVGVEVTADVMWVETLNGWNYIAIGNPATPAQPGSNCTLYPQYSSISQTNENAMELRIAVSFPSTFSGVLQDHLYVTDTLGQDHWDRWDLGSDPQWNWFVWPSSTSGPAPTLPGSFTSCIATPNSSCTLYPYLDSSGYIVPYSIGQTYEVAQGVTMSAQGGASIQRSPNGGASGFPGVSPMLHVPPGSTNVSINNLNVLGNRWAIGNPAQPQIANPDNPAQSEITNLGEFTTQVALAARDQIPTNYGIQEDVIVDTDLAVLSGNDFYDAPGFGLVLQSIGPHTPNQTPSVQVNGGSANNSNQAGIITYGNSSLAAPCLSRGGYFGSNGYASGVPANILISGVHLSNSSGGPIVISNGYGVTLTGNTIQDHQLEPPAYDFESAGGGFNTNISNNTLTNIAAEGIYLERTCGASVHKNSIMTANARQQGDGGANQFRTGGIMMASQNNYNRTVQDALVWGSSVSHSAAGLYFFAATPPSFSNVSIQYSCLSSSVPLQPLFGGTLPAGVDPSFSSFCGAPPPPPAAMSCSAFQ